MSPRRRKNDSRARRRNLNVRPNGVLFLALAFGELPEGDANHTHANISNTNELLGDEPTTDSREGVAQFIDWYRANQEWYDPLVRQS
jgi:nucleoside-diphosphate-sugar epimerase